MWQILTVLFTASLGLYILRDRSNEGLIISLVCAVLWNVPLVIVGNSSSAGFFPIDVIVLLAAANFFLTRTNRYCFGKRRLEFYTLLSLVLYAIIRAGCVLLFDDYGYYNNFIIYGAFRWMLFALTFMLFTEHSFLPCDYPKVINSVGCILVFYMIAAILHQQSVVDLSASQATGHATVYVRSWEVASIFRTFLGANSATVGCIGALGVLLGLFQLRYSKRNTKYAVILIGLSFWVVIGSWSRSDLVALVASLGVGSMIWWRTTFVRAAQKMVFVVVGLCFFSAFLIGSEDQILQSKTMDRFWGTDYVGEYSGRAEGTGAFRSRHHDLAEIYWKKNPEYALFGFGPNGYRMLPVNGVGRMNFGHNIYYHFIGELGLVGLALFFLYLFAVIRGLVNMNVKKSSVAKDLSLLIGLFILQRLVAGIAVDTIFAVDNMLPVTILFFFVVGILGGYTPQKLMLNNG